MKRLPILLLITGAVLACPAPTRADEGSLGLGAGIVKPGDLDSTFWVTANLRFPLGEYFALEPEVGYWKREETFLGINASVEDLNFGGSLLVIIPAKPIEAFAGGGAGGHRIKGGVGVPGFTIISGSEVRFGYHILGGIDLKASDSFSVFGAIRLDWVTEEVGDATKETKYYGGIRLRF